MPFRLAAKNVFLTYSNCLKQNPNILDEFEEHDACTPEGMIGIMMNCLAENSSQKRTPKILMCYENHKERESDFHFHVLLQYEKKIDITNERHFDLFGLHPSIEPCRSVLAAKTYIKKDGRYSTNYEEADPEAHTSEG